MRQVLTLLSIAATTSLQLSAPVQQRRPRRLVTLRAHDPTEYSAPAHCQPRRPVLDRRKALAACVCFLTTPAYATEASEIVAEVMQEPAVDILANPALVWKVGDAQGKAVSLARVRRVFPGPFVNYLSRFLLAYDDGSRALWRADSS